MVCQIGYTWLMTSQPVISPPVHRSGALLDRLARRMRLRAEDDSQREVLYHLLL